MGSDDWRVVAMLDPQGDLIRRSERSVIRGPVKSITIKGSDLVGIELVWAAMGEKEDSGLVQHWAAASWDLETLQLPPGPLWFEIVGKPRDDQRIVFAIGPVSFVIYVDKQGDFDPSQVEGLVLDDKAVEPSSLYTHDQ